MTFHELSMPNLFEINMMIDLDSTELIKDVFKLSYVSLDATTLHETRKQETVSQKG